MFKIYLISNTINNKVYVGKTKQSVAARFAEHFYNAKWGYNFYFYKALRKYGRDNFTVQEIASAETEAEANNLERIYIILFRSSESEFGYNGTLGGDGVTPTPELRRRQSEAKLGPKNPNYGKKISDAQKRAISAACKGANSPAYRKDLVVEELVKLYENGSSCEQIATLNKTCAKSIRQRLVSAGAYVKHRRRFSPVRKADTWEPITR